MKKKKMPLYVKILIGMALGVVWGMFAVYAGLIEFTNDWVKPWGTIFINLLKLIAVPLIFVSLVKGITSLKGISSLSRIGLKTIAFYLSTTIIATFIGLLVVNMVQPGNTFPEDKREEYKQQFSSTIEQKQMAADKVQDESPLRTLIDMVPDNIFAAASDNSKMLQIIFFAILFGIAIVTLPEEKTMSVKNLFSQFNDIILRIIDMIMYVAPYGVFALIAALIVDFAGDADLFAALGLYAIAVIIGLLSMIFIVYPAILRIFAKFNYRNFFRGILPAQMVAFSTSSSAATLPVTKEQCEQELGVSEEISSFVLPVGVTINMDGTSCYQAVAAVFIAQVFGHDLTLAQQMVIVFTAVLSSIGSPGVPGGSIVMLIIVLSSVGIPVEGLALILGIDRPLDMLRTIVNITGDSVVATIVAKLEGKLDTDVLHRKAKKLKASEVLVEDIQDKINRN